MISTSQVKEMLAMWEKLSRDIEKKQPEIVSTDPVSTIFDDSGWSHFCNISTSGC